MSETRRKFVEVFGEQEAECLERAAQSHRSETEMSNPFLMLQVAFTGGQRRKAEDQFLLDIAWCISWECLSLESFYKHHGFKADKEKVRQWIRANAVPPAEYRDPCATLKYTQYLLELDLV